jgi:hypothetical protein
MYAPINPKSAPDAPTVLCGENMKLNTFPQTALATTMVKYPHVPKLSSTGLEHDHKLTQFICDAHATRCVIGCNHHAERTSQAGTPLLLCQATTVLAAVGEGVPVGEGCWHDKTPK